jgi:hypothetical protein
MSNCRPLALWRSADQPTWGDRKWHVYMAVLCHAGVGVASWSGELVCLHLEHQLPESYI